MRNKKRLTYCNQLTVFLFLVLLLMPLWEARAGSLTYGRDYLNRNAQNLTSGVSHEIIFTPATSVSGGAGNNKIELVFPDGDDGKWCATAGTDLTITTTNLHDLASAVSGASLTAACVKGSGASSYDTITVSGVDNMTAGTMYGIRVADGATGKLGTPASGSAMITIRTNNGTIDVDARNVAVSIIDDDQIVVTGVVDPVFTFSLSGNSMGFGSIFPSVVRYATDDGNGSASEAANDLPIKVTLATNAQSGAVIEIKDTNADSGSGMYNVSSDTTLPSSASTGVVSGTPGFGVYGKNASNITLDEKFDNDSSSDGSISSDFQTIASTNGTIASASFDISAVAAISSTTPAGDYADTLTVIGTGKF